MMARPAQRCRDIRQFSGPGLEVLEDLSHAPVSSSTPYTVSFLPPCRKVTLSSTVMTLPAPLLAQGHRLIQTTLHSFQGGERPSRRTLSSVLTDKIWPSSSLLHDVLLSKAHDHTLGAGEDKADDRVHRNAMRVQSEHRHTTRD